MDGLDKQLRTDNFQPHVGPESDKKSTERDSMSLKFGIYLVEQRIISPEQFCGLVKIQQEAGASLATVAIRKNLLTIKQVATVLDQMEMTPAKSFVQIAIENDFLDRDDAEMLLHEQQLASPTIRSLVQECGLLTERQCAVLFQHYQRVGTRPMSRPTSQESGPAMPSESEMEMPTQTEMPATQNSADGMGPRAPKFKQRPVIVSQYTSPANA